MSCCGKKRSKARQSNQTARTLNPAKKTVAQRPVKKDPSTYFQYVGENGLTIIGPVSQRRYRFEHPDAVVAIDPRDEQALSGVSVLRRVRRVTNVSN